MTREEAIEWFKLMKEKFENTKYADALNMAIEALEQDKKEIINMKSVFNLSDDLISRQAAIYALRAMQTYKLGAGEDMLLIDQAEAQTELMLLPSAQPFTAEQIQTMQELESAQVEKAYELGKGDRPTGHWIEDEKQNVLMRKFIEKGEVWRICSVCGAGLMIGAEYETDKYYHETFHNFCPNCGADMRGEDE